MADRLFFQDLFTDNTKMPYKKSVTGTAIIGGRLRLSEAKFCKVICGIQLNV